MAAREAVVAAIRQVADENGQQLPPLTDELVLLDSGLDSLSIAIIVARLEEALGVDPFSDSQSDEMAYPVTLGDFIRFYERAAGDRVVESEFTG
jgi:acyl carrier protein